MNANTLMDRHGKPLAIGDIVRIVKLSQEFIEEFPEEERTLIESMIGNFFKIVGLDEFGQPWVYREWHDERGQLQAHKIALDAEEVELIS